MVYGFVHRKCLCDNLLAYKGSHTYQKNSLNQLATSNYDLTLLNVIGNAMTAQVDTWSTLAIGLDFTMAAVAFFLAISALCIGDSSVQNFFEWGQV